MILLYVVLNGCHMNLPWYLHVTTKTNIYIKKNVACNKFKINKLDLAFCINCIVSVRCIYRCINNWNILKLHQMDTNMKRRWKLHLGFTHHTNRDPKRWKRTPSVFKCVFVCEFLIVPGRYHSRLIKRERERDKTWLYEDIGHCVGCVRAQHIFCMRYVASLCAERPCLH